MTVTEYVRHVLDSYGVTEQEIIGFDDMVRDLTNAHTDAPSAGPQPTSCECEPSLGCRSLGDDECWCGGAA